MQTKATVRFYYTLTLEWLKLNKTDIFSTNHTTLWLWTCLSIPIKYKLIREKKKRLTIKSGGEDLEQLELSHIAGGNTEYTDTLESIMAVSYKLKHILGMWPSNSTSRYLPKNNENIYPCKDLYTKIHNSQKFSALQMSIKWWMVNFSTSIVYVIQLDITNNWNINKQHDEFQNIMLGKRSQTQKTMCYMIPLVWNSRKDKTIGTGSRSTVAWGCRWERGPTANEWEETF